MEQAMWGLIAVVGVVLAAPRLGYEWRGAANRLTLSSGLFCFALLCEGIQSVSATTDWQTLWTLTGSVATGAGGFSLFLAVSGFPRSRDL